jgi:hypothetical protein
VRAAARLIVLLGAIGIGLLLFRESPRELDLVYDLGRAPGATALEISIRRGSELVRRAELRVPPGAATVHHAVRLPDGAYTLAFRVETPRGGFEGERPLEVVEAGTIVLPLGP